MDRGIRLAIEANDLVLAVDADVVLLAVMAFAVLLGPARVLVLSRAFFAGFSS